MEKEKKSNVLLILFIVLTLVLAGYIVYDKVLNKNEKKLVCDCDKVSDNSVSCDDINYLKIFNDMKNYDGKYSSYKTITMTDYQERHAYASILVNGQVTFKVDNASNNDEFYTLSNVKDAVEIAFDDLASGNTLYIRDKNGYVYKYSIDDYESKKISATKMDDLKNVKEFFNITSCSIPDAGCDVSFGVIMNDSYEIISSMGY